MNRRQAKRLVYSQLALFLDPVMHENQFLQQDSNGNLLSDSDYKRCKNALIEILEDFERKSRKIK